MEQFSQQKINCGLYERESELGNRQKSFAKALIGHQLIVFGQTKLRVIGNDNFPL